MKESGSIGKGKMHRIIEEWEAGNETQKSICARYGVSLSVFKYWRHRGFSSKVIGQESKAVDSSVQASAASQPTGAASTFIALQVEPDRALSAHYSLHFPNGVELRCPAGTVSSELRALIQLF